MVFANQVAMHGVKPLILNQCLHIRYDILYIYILYIIYII